MAFQFHSDKDRYFQIQELVTAEHIIPFIEEATKISDWSDKKILEVGCGEAGVLKAFLKKGCEKAVGIELSEYRADLARQFMANHIQESKLEIVISDIHESSIQNKYHSYFDLIILKDVIEHLYEKERIIRTLNSFLKDNGVIFFAFPPWQMPFGGHQQICNHRLLSKLPYIHLLPYRLYEKLLDTFREPKSTIKELMEIKDTRISIEHFEVLMSAADLQIIRCTYFLFNPIYKFKFNLRPREQLYLISKIRYIRNYLTTAVYYVVKKNDL